MLMAKLFQTSKSITNNWPEVKFTFHDPTVIGVAGGEQKQKLLLPLRGNYINALVTDQKTAGK